MLTSFDKAIVAFIVPVVIVFLSHFGILPQMTIQDAVTMIVGGLVTSGGVWIAKNK